MKRLIFPDIFRGQATAFFTGKDPGADRAAISRVFRLGPEKVYMPLQKHTDTVQVLDSDRGQKIADAVVTREHGILIGVQVADCVPILLSDAQRHVIAAVHAGWRGTAAGILEKTLKIMIDRFGCSPRDIKIASGPSIRWCCYGVDNDVFRAVERASGPGGYHRMKGEKFCLDLASANKAQALASGIPESNIQISDDCTFCNPDKFFSYRFAKGPTGRQGGFIGMLDARERRS